MGICSTQPARGAGNTVFPTTASCFLGVHYLPDGIAFVCGDMDALVSTRAFVFLERGPDPLKDGLNEDVIIEGRSGKRPDRVESKSELFTFTLGEENVLADD